MAVGSSLQPELHICFVVLYAGQQGGYPPQGGQAGQGYPPQQGGQQYPQQGGQGYPPQQGGQGYPQQGQQLPGTGSSHLLSWLCVPRRQELLSPFWRPDLLLINAAARFTYSVSQLAACSPKQAQAASSVAQMLHCPRVHAGLKSRHAHAKDHDV